MQTASEASSPLVDDATARSAKMTSPSSCRGDHINAAVHSVHADGRPPSPPPPTADQTPTDPVRPPVTAVPLAVLEEFNAGVTDTEDAPAGGSSTSAAAQGRRSRFSGSGRSKRSPLTTSNGPVSSPPPSGPGPPVDAPVVVDMNSNDKDRKSAATAEAAAAALASRYDRWDRTLDEEEDEAAAPLGGGGRNDDDDAGNYDADDAMLEFAESYFNAQPSQFNQSALARTVNIVTRKSLNVSTAIFTIVSCRYYYTALFHQIMVEKKKKE